MRGGNILSICFKTFHFYLNIIHIEIIKIIFSVDLHCFTEARFCCVAQYDLKLEILLAKPPEYKSEDVYPFARA